MFLAAVNHANGTIEHLPVAGGMLDQPVRTMQIMRFLQGLYIECMPKEMIRDPMNG